MPSPWHNAGPPRPAAAAQHQMMSVTLTHRACCATSASAATAAVVLAGTGVAAQLIAELGGEVQRLSAALGRPPGLAVVVVGQRADSLLYVTRKQEACQRVSAASLRAPPLAPRPGGTSQTHAVHVPRGPRAQAGVRVLVHQLPEHVSQHELEQAVRHLCLDAAVDGLLVQLPLPRHLCEEAVMEHIDPAKDVDGFHPLNMG